PAMADAATFGTIRNEIAYYNNPDGGMNQIYSPQEIQLFTNGSDPLNYPNTNWAEETLKDVSIQTRHNLNVRGGGEHINYYFSLGSISQDGLYKDGATDYTQYHVRSNIDAQISERLKIGVSLSGRKEDRRSEEHTSELQSRENLVCRLLLEKKKKKINTVSIY